MDTKARVYSIIEDIVYRVPPGNYMDKEPDSVRVREDLGLKDIDLIEIEMAIEEDFGINIPDGDLFALKTLGDMIRHIDGVILSG